MSMRRATVTLGIAGALLSLGCGVPQSKHDTTVNKLRQAERNLSLTQDAHNTTKQKLTTAEMQIKGMRSHLQSVQNSASELKARVASLESRLQACKVPPSAPSRPSAPPPPPPDAGAAAATGGLDLAAVQAGVNKVMPKVKKCYQKEVIKKGKKLEGTLIVKFTIHRRGKTRGVKVRKGTISHRRLERCVRNVFRRARFPRSKKNTQVSYPLRFAP
jgi:TonB family protein